MKHLLLIHLVLFAVYAFSAEVRIGTNEVDLSFEYETSSQTDKAADLSSKKEILSQADKALIAEDIQHVLSTATVGKMKLEPHKDTKRQSHGIKGRISIGAEGHYWPRAFWMNDFGDYRVDEKTSRKELIVPKKLVDVYREAIELKNNHPDAFASLDIFLKQLHTGFQPKKMTLAEKKALFWFPPEVPAWSKEKYYDDNLRDTKTISFKRPSLLFFQETQIKGRSVIYCRPVIELKKDGSHHRMVLVYDGTRWRIGPS